MSHTSRCTIHTRCRSYRTGRVRWLAWCRRGGAVAAVVVIPCHVTNVVATAVFVVAAVVATARSKLPFSLGGQTEVATCVAVKAIDKCLAVVPTHLFYWQIVTFEIGWIAAHDGSPEGLRHLIFANVVAAEGGLFAAISFTPLLTCAPPPW